MKTTKQAEPGSLEHIKPVSKEVMDAVGKSIDKLAKKYPVKHQPTATIRFRRFKDLDKDAQP